MRGFFVVYSCSLEMWPTRPYCDVGFRHTKPFATQSAFMLRTPQRFRFMTNTKADLLNAHAAMASVLDAKFASLPEWRAFRSIDKALIDFISDAPSGSPVSPLAAYRVPLSKPSKPSYVDLGLAALEEAGKPQNTAAMVQYIASKRGVDNLEKARINIASAFSHDDRLKSISWLGGPAWWFADRPIPKKESAG